MEEFHAHWLLHDWEQSIYSKILSACLILKNQHFEDWAASIQSLNVSLQGTASHQDDGHICLQLEAGLNRELQSAEKDAKVNEEMSLHPWISKVKDLNNHCIVQCKHVAKAIEEAMR